MKEIWWILLSIIIGAILATGFWLLTGDGHNQMNAMRIGFAIVMGLIGVIIGCIIRILNINL